MHGDWTLTPVAIFFHLSNCPCTVAAVAYAAAEEHRAYWTPTHHMHPPGNEEGETLKQGSGKSGLMRDLFPDSYVARKIACSLAAMHGGWIVVRLTIGKRVRIGRHETNINAWSTR